MESLESLSMLRAGVRMDGGRPTTAPPRRRARPRPVAELGPRGARAAFVGGDADPVRWVAPPSSRGRPTPGGARGRRDRALDPESARGARGGAARPARAAGPAGQLQPNPHTPKDVVKCDCMLNPKSKTATCAGVCGARARAAVRGRGGRRGVERARLVPQCALCAWDRSAALHGARLPTPLPPGPSARWRRRARAWALRAGGRGSRGARQPGAAAAARAGARRDRSQRRSR